MRVLVTGATGFICAPILRALAGQGHETIAVVRTAAATVEAARTIVWDFERKRRPESLPRDVEAIVHGAQSRNYRTFPGDSGSMFRVNVGGSWSVLDYAAETGVGRFCLLSSGTVYEPYRGPLVEDSTVEPTSFLGATKLAAEVVARPYQKLFALAVLRLFAPYGPGQKSRLVPDIIERVRTGRAVQLAADAAGLWLTPTYVDDIAYIVATAITEAWTGTINVASPKVVSLRQLAETIGALYGRRPVFEVTEHEPVRIVPVLERLGARYDISRFRPLERALHGMIATEGG